jgi:hypothetical protein
MADLQQDEGDADILCIGAPTPGFGDLRVLDQITISVSAGLVRGLVGPNGAGATRVDVFRSTVAGIKLKVSALTKAHKLARKPIFTEGITTVLQPSGVATYFDKIHTTGFVKLPAPQSFSSDPAVSEFKPRVQPYSPGGECEHPQRSLALRHRGSARPGSRR